MTYPPQWRSERDPAIAAQLIREYPFAHLITSHTGLHATRIPFVIDNVGNGVTQLSAHLNRQNPQVEGLDGSEVLVVFSGASTYVSPHWRTDLSRAGTIDYEEVRARGKARVIDDIEKFCDFINRLSSLLEPQYREAGEYPVWTTDMAPTGYIERLYPNITLFRIEIESLEMISKLHQSFPDEDRRTIAKHLSRCDRDGARSIAEKINNQLKS